MSDVTKTTVYLYTTDYRRLKELARTEGKATAEVVREALAEYAATRGSRKRPSSVGVGRSGRHDLSIRAEQLLAGMGRKK